MSQQVPMQFGGDKENFEATFNQDMSSEEESSDQQVYKTQLQDGVQAAPTIQSQDFDLNEQANVYKSIKQRNSTRNLINTHNPMNWTQHQEAISQTIKDLSEMTRRNIRELFPLQYDQVMETLMRAFAHDENNSLLLLARSKQTLQALTQQVEKDIKLRMEEVNDQFSLKVVRVNCSLNNSENKMLIRFCQCLGLTDQQSAFYTVDMINRVAEYFKENPDSCVLFLFEDIDYYIETTKQVLLYKILDMLQYCAIKFAFVATSMKVDVADSFEKRVKSRFSHRQVLLYELQLDVFDQILNSQFRDRIDLIDADDESGKSLQDAYRDLHRLATCPGAQEIRIVYHDSGKGYEYLAQQLRIVLSYLDQQLKIKPLAGEAVQKHEKDEYLDFVFGKSLRMIGLVQENAEYATVLKSLPKSSIIVLVAAHKVASKASLFNFEAVHTKYKNYMQNHETMGGMIQILSKQTFLKVFIDLVDKGFLKSENDTDVLSVNNKVSLGFRYGDLHETLNAKSFQNAVNLPSTIIGWISMSN